MYINCRFNRIAAHNPMSNTGYTCALTSLTDSLSDRVGEHTFFCDSHLVISAKSRKFAL